MVMNKRGQGLSTNAIVLIILAVVVLAVLVIGFSMGWERLAPWLSSSNVDTIIQQCAVACATNAANDYCVKERTLDDGTNEITGTCKDFLSKGVEDCSNICPSEYEYVWVAGLDDCINNPIQEIVSDPNCASVTKETQEAVCCKRIK